MSEQSPWGQPPPPSTPAGGSYPPPPAQGPPGVPPGGWTPPAYGGGPPGPPPPKRNTAAIIAIAVGTLVVIAAVVVTLVVTSGDDDPGTASDTASTSAAPNDPTDDPTTESTSDPTSEPTADPTSDAPPPSEDTIVGDGYTFELPGIGWQDALDEAQSSGLGATLDTIIILGTSLDLAQSNILVEALSGGGAPDLESLEGQWKRNLGGSDGAVPDDIADITIDGERAIGVRFSDRENVNGFFIDQVVYLTLHNGNQYSIALSLPSEDDAVSEDDFAKVLDSWTWTS